MKLSSCCKAEYKTQMVAAFSRKINKLYPWHTCSACGQKCAIIKISERTIRRGIQRKDTIQSDAYFKDWYLKFKDLV